MKTRSLLFAIILLGTLVVFTPAARADEMDFVLAQAAASLPSGSARSAEFSFDSQYYAIATSVSPYIYVYNVTGVGPSSPPVKLADPSTLPSSSVFNLAWSPTENVLAVALTGASPSIQFFTVSGSTITKCTDPAQPGIAGTYLNFSKDGAFVAFSLQAASPGVWVYSMGGGCSVTKVTSQPASTCGNGGMPGFNTDASLLVLPCANSPFFAWWQRTGSGTSSSWTTLTNPATMPTNAMAMASFNSNATYMVVGADSNVVNSFPYSRSGTTLTSITQTPGTTDIAWQEWGSTGALVTALSTGANFSVNYANGAGNLALVLKDTNPTNAVTCGVAWAPNGQYFVVGSSAGTERIIVYFYNQSAQTARKLSAPSSVPTTNCISNGGAGFASTSRTVAWSKSGTLVAYARSASFSLYTTTLGIVSTPPDAPVLTASISTTLPQRCVLVWTTPATNGGTLQGYNVTETSDWGQVIPYNLSILNTLSVFVHSRTYNYTVHAWTSVGNGAESNVASCSQAGGLSGDNGYLYGGNRANQASALGISTSATDIFWAILITLFGVMVGYLSLARVGYGGIGASMGGLTALVFEYALNIVPTWAVLFELVTFAALFGAAYRMRERAA